jgi:hypothetical protein
MRYAHTGDISLINEAIELNREVLALQLLGHLDPGISFVNLATLLHAQYKQTGDVVLLDEAIELNRETLVLRSRVTLIEPKLAATLDLCFMCTMSGPGMSRCWMKQ